MMINDETCDVLPFCHFAMAYDEISMWVLPCIIPTTGYFFLHRWVRRYISAMAGKSHRNHAFSMEKWGILSKPCLKTLCEGMMNTKNWMKGRLLAISMTWFSLQPSQSGISWFVGNFDVQRPGKYHKTCRLREVLQHGSSIGPCCKSKAGM